MTQLKTAVLTDLAKRINKCQDLLETHFANMLERARQMGELLIQAKEEVDHGEWEDWLEEYAPRVTNRQCQKYIRLAKHWEEIEAKTNSSSFLGINEALESIASSNGKPKKPAKKPAPPPETSESDDPFADELPWEDVEDDEPPTQPSLPTPERSESERFKLARTVAKKHLEAGMRAVDDCCRIRGQADQSECIVEITNALKRLNRWR